MTTETTLRAPLRTPGLAQSTSDPQAYQAWRDFLGSPAASHAQLVAQISTDLAPLIKNLDSEERAEFFRELAEALSRPGDEALSEALDGWFLSSELLENPLRREILLGESTEDDFVEVDRPE